MSLYSLMLFVHVTAAVCLFIGLGMWVAGIAAMAHAIRVEQVRTIVDLMLMVRLVVPISVVLVLVAGGTMTLMSWGFQTGWIVVTLGSLVVIGPIGTWIVDPNVHAIAALAHSVPDGALPGNLAAATQNRRLRMAIHTMTALLFGIIFLMTTKPTLMGALAAMGVSGLLGIASSLPFQHARQVGSSDRLDSHEKHGS
jgi:hypothetical protein